jgi:hypothetical protein
MKFLKTFYRQIIFLLIGLLSGFLISRFSHIHFEEKINPIAFASLILTILLAIYLEFAVRPSLTNSRNEKDIIIDQLKEIRSSCSEVHSQYEKIHNLRNIPQEERSELLSRFRLLSNHIDFLNDIIKYSKIKPVGAISKEISSKYFKYKKSLTGFGFDKENFFFDRIYFSKHESAYKELSKAIMHLIIDVNKL